jgi:hypothetical protein
MAQLPTPSETLAQIDARQDEVLAQLDELERRILRALCECGAADAASVAKPAMADPVKKAA